MDYKEFLYDGTRKFTGSKTDDTPGIDNEEDSAALLNKNKQKISQLQNTLYAEGQQGLIVIFQAMDAAGKDGTIKHVFSGVNPAGISVNSFKSPSSTELAHDYLWRIHQAVPKFGGIGVFNRSHYEDVLISRVLDLPRQQNLTPRIYEKVWENRYQQIRDFERHLYQNGYTIVKFFLNVSKEEQRKRFLERLDTPEKNWKFSVDDLSTREKWDSYMKAYKECINQTAAPYAPWIVVPADHKWYMRTLVSEVVKDALKKMNPKPPTLSKAEMEELAICRKQLLKDR